MELKGKVAILTGAGPNINAGIARGLGLAGAEVVCLDLREDYLDACTRWLRGLGVSAEGLTCDVTAESEVDAAVASVVARHGRVDVLVNAAGLHRAQGVLAGDLATFRLHLDTILVGAYLTTRAVARTMVAKSTSGSIINLLSTEAHQGNPLSVGYGSAKSGLWGLTRATAMELAEHGIRVNSLTPTGTDPADGFRRAQEWGVEWGLSSSRADTPSTFTRGDMGVPLGHRPGPDDYADAVVFLASDRSKMITGTDLRVDGGVLARYWRWTPGGEG
ncbi:MAG: dehydrogenase, short-chain alcohol dehydrogenase like protein [Frankiales bacterium]|jgi:NAD(P)-dependent dehydrogenase (short-subunit alcohol dehydrogenase family)|nr:dehydrogenase, short-chain alcohol dehydrogenase like protein [Frankiales bacterium]